MGTRAPLDWRRSPGGCNAAQGASMGRKPYNMRDKHYNMRDKHFCLPRILLLLPPLSPKKLGVSASSVIFAGKTSHSKEFP